MTKTFGIVMSPITMIKPHKDSNLALLLEAKRRGWQIHYMESGDLFIRNGQVFAQTKTLEVFDDEQKWFEVISEQTTRLADLDLIMLRIDPPFDTEYLHTTQLLELAEKEGATVVNKPQSVRDFNEKLSTLNFPECCPPTLVSNQKTAIKEFLGEYGDIILKPLDGFGGQSIFRVTKTNNNVNAIIEMLTKDGKEKIIAQKYLPEIKAGDKRILLINGEPISHVLARIPSKDETRANLAAGGTGKVIELSDRDRFICRQISAILKEKGLLFVGVDIIGDYLTEINVTSPTCIREIEKETGLNICSQIFDHAMTLVKS